MKDRDMRVLKVNNIKIKIPKAKKNLDLRYPFFFRKKFVPKLEPIFENEELTSKCVSQK